MGEAKVLKSFREGSHPAWLIEFPITIQYTNAHTTINKPLIVTLRVVQTAEQENTVQGLGVEQFVLQEK